MWQKQSTYPHLECTYTDTHTQQGRKLTISCIWQCVTLNESKFKLVKYFIKCGNVKKKSLEFVSKRIKEEFKVPEV